MASKCPSCLVCGPGVTAARARRVVIDGHEVYLCSSHAALVRKAGPSSFEELRDLFRPANPADRRSPIPRREPSGDDRRMFPPRPEGRRLGAGRRTTDPRD